MIKLHDEEEGGGEPVRGLPQALPEGEQLLWQGSPGTLAFAIHAFHIRFVLGYFVLATSWRLANMDTAGATGLEMTRVAINSGIGAAAGIGLLVLIAWAMARATVYTVTSKRVVLRYGVAIRKYVNLPFDQIASADMRRYGKDKGDIVLSLASAGGLAYMRLWPHVRPLRINRPQPMFRGLTGVDAVARTLASAITAHAPNRVTQATVAAPARPTLTAPGLAASAT
ncbi:photosynthetic complex putative assembly protein PuhB [Hyphomonas sp.]|uniref:photosynthetic complex putative assembly protein PuhB n=1 Tax=Hyphomonas sp. TaxID=87 RepID=UPI0025C3BA52|nr:photosynthetic complex putative assembly protein PuhB [Hyphomonas sp.]